MPREASHDGIEVIFFELILIAMLAVFAVFKPAFSRLFSCFSSADPLVCDHNVAHAVTDRFVSARART